MTAKKLIGQIHLWLGLASGLVVVILGITGCLYVFIDELEPVVYKEHLVVEQQATAPLPINFLKAAAQVAIGKEYPITRFEIPGEADRSYKFYASKRDDKALTYFGEVIYSYNAYVNPYTGEVLKVENGKYEFFNLVVTLHYDLFLQKLGKQIVGWSTIIFILLLISGIVLWWPKNKSAAKQRVWFRWKETTQWKRKNYDLHNILGFYTMILALIIALTGLVWAFPWFNDSVQFLANGGKTIEKQKPALSDTTLLSLRSDLDLSIQHVRAQVPVANYYFINLPKENKSTLSIFASGQGSERYRFTSFQFDQYSGALLKKESFDDKSSGQKLRSMNYDIHVGSILGLTGKILAFLASFVAAGLPITGLYIWLNKKKNNKKQSKPVTALQKMHPARPKKKIKLDKVAF
ncbi:MAG: PepSY protein [Cytophagaceae bacterium]|jgi:uncharacterized iron-regulated membrane protein|nr:PepSY protein [Cytophagaceae bacterium]